MNIKNIVLIILLIGISIYQANEDKWTTGSDNFSSKNSSNTSLQDAYKNKRSDYQIQDTGIVIKVLPDDLKGSRHQKFLLKGRSGKTVLIAHNIDLAPRIKNLRKGDNVEFFGEYEWNPKGGVVHWTHHDPKGYHVSGWLKHGGKTYQ